jgi:hypothetical protein
VSHPEVPDVPEEKPSRADLALYERAVRNDWPIPPKMKQRILQIAMNLADPEEEDELPPQFEEIPAKAGGEEPLTIDNTERRSLLRSRRDRLKARGEQLLVSMSRLNIEQQKLDLMRAKHEFMIASKTKTDNESSEGIAADMAAKALQILNGDSDPSTAAAASGDPRDPAGDG